MKATEGFKPISVKNPASHPLRFRLRCFIDLQLASIVRFLRPQLATLHGRVLDVGAGESPWRSWLPEEATYQGLDLANASDFGMASTVQDVVHYDGGTMPFDDSSFDAALCVEVLEHAAEPTLLLDEIARVLTDGGVLLATVPWSARRHHVPFDFHRFTPDRLRPMLEKAGFVDVVVTERSSDIGAIANKLTVLNIRLLRPRMRPSWPLTVLLGLVLLPVTVIFLVAANIADHWNLGGKEDPLGYFIRAERRGPACEAPGRA